MDFDYFLFICLFIIHEKKRERKKEKKSDQSNFCRLLLFTNKRDNYLRILFGRATNLKNKEIQ
jgi:hypothetical protein